MISYRVLLAATLSIFIIAILFFLVPIKKQNPTLEDSIIYQAKTLVYWPTIAIILTVILAVVYLYPYHY